MSWRCNICDTYNEESKRKCYVCGQPRSEKSIHEGKIREREECAIRVSRLIFKKGYGISTFLFVLGVSIAVLVTVIALIIILLSGNISGVVTKLAYVIDHIYSRIANNNIANVMDWIEHFSYVSMQKIGINIDVILLKWHSALTTISVLAENLCACVKKHIEFCYINRIVLISNLFGIKASYFF